MRHRWPTDPDKELREEPKARLKPLIAHIIPYEFTCTGLARFVVDLARHQVTWAEVHIIHLARAQNGFWDAFLGGVSRHAARDEREAEQILRSLRPDFIHHHLLENKFALKEPLAFPHTLISTSHRWESNLKPDPTCIPTTGDSPGVIRLGVDLDVFRPAGTRHTETKTVKKTTAGVISVGGVQLVPGKMTFTNQEWLALSTGEHAALIQGMIGKGELIVGDNALAVDNRFVVGIVGRLSPEKVPHSFLHAAKNWAANHPEYIFRFIGRGIQTDMVLTSEKIIRQIGGAELKGDIAPDQVWRCYQDLDALCIPSTNESVSYAAIEAMASGVPVVARSVQGLPATIGDAGILCRNDLELLEALERIRTDKALAQDLSAKGRARAENLFDLRRMREQYDQAYRARRRPEAVKEERPAPPPLHLVEPPKFQPFAMIKRGKPAIVHVWPWKFVTGGAERFIFEICSATKKLFENHVVAPEFKSRFNLADADAQHHIIPQTLPGLFADLVDGLEPDVLVLHLFYANMGNIYGKHRLKSGKTIAVLHGDPDASDFCDLDVKKVFIMAPATNPCWEGKPTEMMKLGVDLEAFKAKEHTEKAELKALIVARLAPEKLPDSFLNVLPLPAPWTLSVVGEAYTPEGRKIEAKLNEKGAAMLGTVAPAEMAKVYQEHDAVLIPSTTEAGSYVACEAMASGLPIVWRANAGLYGLLKDAAFKYIGNGNSADQAMMNAIATLSDANKRRECGMGLRILAEEGHSLKRWRDQFASTVMDLL